jgi:hypothetical protein
VVLSADISDHPSLAATGCQCSFCQLRTVTSASDVPLLLCVAACSSSALSAESTALTCGELAQAQHPAREPRAPTGSEFVRQIAKLSDDERESAILEQALRGNIPAFLSRSEPVRLNGRSAEGTAVTITLCVSPDYLAVGSDTDYLARVVSDEGVIRNAGELLRTLQSRVLSSARGDSRPAHEIKEVPIIRETEEPGRQLGTALPIDLTHPFDEMPHN